MRVGLGKAALAGAGTGAGVVALSFVGDSAAGLPNAPFVLFHGLARVLPGGLGAWTSDTPMVAIGLGPGSRAIAGSAASVVMFLALGVVLGLALAVVARRGERHLEIWGASVGLSLFAVLAGMSARVGFGAAGVFPGTVWLASLLLGWGLVLSGAVQALGRESVAPAAPTSLRALTTRH